MTTSPPHVEIDSDSKLVFYCNKCSSPIPHTDGGIYECERCGWKYICPYCK